MNIVVPQGCPFQEETPELAAEREAEEKAWHEEMGRLIEEGYVTEENEPLKCTACESEDLEDIVTDTLDGYTVMGYDRKCKDCGVTLNSWYTGSWAW